VDEIQKAVELLEDESLVWSGDFDTIRLELTQLLRKAAEVRHLELEAELGSLVKAITNEGENNA